VRQAGESFDYRLPDKIEAGRADKVLSRQFVEVSRSRVRKTLDAGLITCGESVVGRRDKLHGGQVLRIAWLKAEDFSASPVDIPLKILYEDADLVVVDKPSGMVTHPGHGTGDRTLVHALLHHTGGILSSVGAPERPGIVHRLDKETSGVVVVAKTDTAHHALVEQFRNRETRKEYLAWVEGEPKGESGLMEKAIARHPVVRTKMRVAHFGRAARTDWRTVLRTGSGATLICCRIHTGRTHQIRVHCSDLGHPILGDATYGYKDRKRFWEPVERIMLHARYLEFLHPIKGVKQEVEAPVPKEFQDLESRITAGRS